MADGGPPPREGNEAAYELPLARSGSASYPSTLPAHALWPHPHGATLLTCSLTSIRVHEKFTKGKKTRGKPTVRAQGSRFLSSGWFALRWANPGKPALTEGSPHGPFASCARSFWCLRIATLLVWGQGLGFKPQPLKHQTQPWPPRCCTQSAFALRPLHPPRRRPRLDLL